MKDLEDKSLQFVLENYRKGMFDTRKALKKIHGEGQDFRPSRRIGLYVAGLAASVLILAGLFMFSRFSDRGEVCVVAEGKNVRHVLPDSTVIMLAPGSALSYATEHFTAGRRVVKMKGKAYFSVTKNKQSPFWVYGQHSVTKVLGTKFQVSEESSDSVTRIYVTSGKVYFASPLQKDKGVILTKGMEAVLPFNGTAPCITGTSSLNPSAWAVNVFIYKEVPIENVLKELSEFYGVKLSTSETNRKVTAEFRTDNLDSILAMLEKVLEIKIKKE